MRHGGAATADAATGKEVDSTAVTIMRVTHGSAANSTGGSTTE